MSTTEPASGSRRPRGPAAPAAATGRRRAGARRAPRPRAAACWSRNGSAAGRRPCGALRSASRRAGWCAHRRRGTSGCARIARSCCGLVGRPAMWNSSSARRVRSTAESNVPRRVRRADDLGEQRIELRRRRVADVAAGIDAHARPGRLLVGGERAGALRRRRAPGRQSRAARRPPSGRRGPSVGQRRAGGDAELRLDEVDAGDLLGDRVLDLDARIALDEEVLAASRDRPGTRPCRRSRSRGARPA